MSSSRNQKCDDFLWRSIMEQEKTNRVNWYFKYLPQQCQEDKDEQNCIRQIKPKPFTSGNSLPPIEQINREISDLIRHKDYKRSVYWTLPIIPRKKSNLEFRMPHNTAGMYQVEQNLENTLYDKTLSSNTSRKAYLKQRQIDAPQTKYKLPITSNWDVGWVQPDSGDVKRPKFAKKNIFLETIGSHHLDGLV
ncbi:hypothetical protein LOD99_12993 [Oopsacas minuta]|uniref:Sperm microtubule inner protein 1 C-terminal domain-containing protein n=1 Tax=Oopsacas minuta TaxID=111878 RepID=A0AAV7JA95_9METZ|nr:hypothetical protein LOD99_12993 [Oopsacas minuta]